MFATLTSKILAALVGAIALLAAGAYGGYRFEEGKLSDLKAQYAQAETKAVQEAKTIQSKEDANAEAQELAEAQAQQKIVTQTITVTKEVPHYVPVIHACVPVGLVRVLNAASGVADSPDAVATGQPNDACTSLSWDQVAGDIADDYGTARANAEQLNALEASVRQLNGDANAAASGSQ